MTHPSHDTRQPPCRPGIAAAPGRTGLACEPLESADVRECPAAPPPQITRLAPSPTGALHLGNARTFLVNWLLARKLNWHIVLRIEDLDTPRIKPHAIQQAIDDLQWLGLDWDAGPTVQTNDLTPYHAALARLYNAGLAYPCVCTRSDIRHAQSAPHADEHDMRYPGSCRPSPGQAAPIQPVGFTNVAGFTLPVWPEQVRSIRLCVPAGTQSFVDEFQGLQSASVDASVGDFVIAKPDWSPAYQLAVVVDDAAAGVTQVVRGDDLVSSTFRQMLIYDDLTLGPHPHYWHLPLVTGADGMRLAKRHGDTRISLFREQGVSSDRMLGLLAFWIGAIPAPQPIRLAKLLDAFEPHLMPRSPSIHRPEHDAWLLSMIT